VLVAVTLKTVFHALPLTLTVGAVALCRRSLARPWLFVLTGFLALSGLQYFVPRLMEYVLRPAGQNALAARNIIVKASAVDIDRETAGKLFGHWAEGLQISMLFAILLLTGLGVALLWRLQRAFRRP
jgi:hypothetical protein